MRVGELTEQDEVGVRVRRGVLVREVGPPGWLRVSIGTPGEMSAFRDALAGVLDSPVA